MLMASLKFSTPSLTIYSRMKQNSSFVRFSSLRASEDKMLMVSPKISIRQYPVVLKEKRAVFGFSGLMEHKGLGCSLLQRKSRFGSIRRRCNNKGWGSEGGGDFDYLEAEILEFMNCSGNPKEIPTKNDLINAGIGDLDLNSGVKEDSEFLHSDGSECDSLEGVDVGIIASEDSSSSAAPSSSGREMEKEESVEEDDAGINGILERLEKERNLSVSCFREKETDIVDLSCKNAYEDYWKLESSSMSAEIGTNGATLFRSRLQHFELELVSTLQSLESASEFYLSLLKDSDSQSDEFLELSNAWEIQETEVMNAKNNLQSIRAKLAILVDKIALASIESQKNSEMKQKRINDAQLALISRRTAWIVWPNKGLVVLVCGSFDGWVIQALQRILMEKTSSGFIILYCGRYEGSSDAFSDSEATDFEEASDRKYIWETLGLLLKSIWGSHLEMQSKTEILLETLVMTVGNGWESLVESNRLEHEERMKTIFPDFDKEQIQPSTIFMSEFEENYFNSVFRMSKSVVEAVRGPVKLLAVVVLTALLFVVRMLLYTIFAPFKAIFGVGLGHMFMMLPNMFFRWFSNDKLGKIFYPKPPKQPAKSKGQEEVKGEVKGKVEVIDFEARCVHDEKLNSQKENG